MKRIVIALGGNALQEAGRPATAQAQLEVVEQTAQYIADIIAQGYEVIIAHGNGPQVGRIVLQNEHAKDITPALPFDVCGAMSQGYIGYHIQQGLAKALKSRRIRKLPVTVVTQVVVDRNDPNFRSPSKPIGPFYSAEEAELIAKEKGYVIKEDAGRGYRRVVASPMPIEIIEIEAVRSLVNAGFVVITVGGGGIPVVRDADGGYHGVAAVIDKDLASECLADDLNADVLVILTAVEKVCINFGKPDEKQLSVMTTEDARRYIYEEQFAPGSMLPKIEAAIRFVEGDYGRKAIITTLDKAVEALNGNAGTTIVRRPGPFIFSGRSTRGYI